MNDNITKKSVALTGAESVLDKYIIKELNRKNVPAKIFVRSLKHTPIFKTKTSSLIETKVNEPKTFKGHLDGIHTVISTLSNPSEKNNFFDICLGYRNNMRLLEEAQKSGVKKFICFVDTTCLLHKNLKVLEEKNNFISKLKESGIDYTIIPHK